MFGIYLLVLRLYANFAPHFFMLTQLAWKISKINIALIYFIYQCNPFTLYINASTVSQGTMLMSHKCSDISIHLFIVWKSFPLIFNNNMANIFLNLFH